MSLTFPTILDNTTLKGYRSCGKKAYWYTHRKLVPVASGIHLVAGGAFAKGLEVTRKAFFVEKLSFEESITLGTIALIATYGENTTHSTAKSCARMVGALDEYFRSYPIETGLQPFQSTTGAYAIEYNFAIPLPRKHPETGEPLLYVGRLDQLTVETGMLFVEDDKTTSSLGQQWHDQWEMSGQMLGYMWACQETGFNVSGAIIRGIAILKTKYETTEKVLLIPQPAVDSWYENTLLTIDRMIEDYKAQKWLMSYGDACNAFGGCPYKFLCSTNDPESRVIGFYKENTWNPLNPT